MKYISQFYDINKKTQTQQVLQNMADIDALKDADDTLQENIDAEEQARTDADGALAYDIADLQNQIDSFGNVFTLKGSVATYGDLPATDNHIGDVWYCEADAVGYVWIDDNGTERWEQLGLPIDLSDYVTTGDLALALDDYQEKLTAGTNISIIDNVISATGGSNNAVLLDNTTQEFDSDKTLELKNADNQLFIKSKLSNNGIKFIPNDTTEGNHATLRVMDGSSHYLQLRYDRLKFNPTGMTYNLYLPYNSGTLALTSDIKSLYAHNIRLNITGYSALNFVICNNTNATFTVDTLVEHIKTITGFISNALPVASRGYDVSSNTSGLTTGIYANDNNAIYLIHIENSYTISGSDIAISTTVNTPTISKNNISISSEKVYQIL